MPSQKKMSIEARRARRKQRRKTPWSDLELLVFAVAAAIFLGMSGHALAIGLDAYNGAQQNRKDAAANHQEYITFFRDVVSHMAMDDEKSPKDEQGDWEVDLTQYEQTEGYAGQLYALRELFDGQIETILRYYEHTVCTVNGEEKTVGEALPEEAIPERLLQLACDNHEALDFVADYPKNHANAGSISPEQRESTTKVPLYIQWDESWGYEAYGDGLISYSGCAPSSMAMAVTYLTEQTVTPLDVCHYADGEGFYVNGTGTDWSFIAQGAQHYGMSAEPLDHVEEALLAKELEAGHLIICTMAPGDFTQTGHFILLTGYQDGQFFVNDPNSLIRSQQTWTFQRLKGQFRQLWALSAD